MKALGALTWPLVIILCLTLGLAPYSPEPHVWQKLQMLLSGTLTGPVDIFDFLLHGAPWLLLVVKVIRR
jgi:hypothetical protein